MSDEAERFPLKSHIDYLIDSGNLETLYEEMGCKTPSRDPKNITCKNCGFHTIETIKSKVKRVETKTKQPVMFHVESEAPSRLPNSYLIPVDIIRHHCVIKEYTTLRERTYRVTDSLSKK